MKNIKKNMKIMNYFMKLKKEIKMKKEKNWIFKQTKICKIY